MHKTCRGIISTLFIRPGSTMTKHQQERCLCCALARVPPPTNLLPGPQYQPPARSQNVWGCYLDALHPPCKIQDRGRARTFPMLVPRAQMPSRRLTTTRSLRPTLARSHDAQVAPAIVSPTIWAQFEGRHRSRFTLPLLPQSPTSTRATATTSLLVLPHPLTQWHQGEESPFPTRTGTNLAAHLICRLYRLSPAADRTFRFH